MSEQSVSIAGYRPTEKTTHLGQNLCGIALMSAFVKLFMTDVIQNVKVNGLRTNELSQIHQKPLYCPYNQYSANGPNVLTEG